MGTGIDFGYGKKIGKMTDEELVRSIKYKELKKIARRAVGEKEKVKIENLRKRADAAYKKEYGEEFTTDKALYEALFGRLKDGKRCEESHKRVIPRKGYNDPSQEITDGYSFLDGGRSCPDATENLGVSSLQD